MKNQKFTQLFNALTTLSCCALLIGSTYITSPISNADVTIGIKNEQSDGSTDSSIDCMPLNDNIPFGEEEV